MTDTVLVELYEVTFGVLEPADDTVTVVASDSFGMSTSGGGGVGAALTVKEEGSAVDTAVESINFVGGSQTAAQTASGAVTVTSTAYYPGGTDVPVTDGGTGASDASTARTNLGLGSIATQASSSVSITGGSITGITDLAIADGGTGSSTAAAARTALGVVQTFAATGGDDTAALQAVLDAYSAVRITGTVLVSSTIKLNEGQELFGDSHRTSIIKLANGSNLTGPIICSKNYTAHTGVSNPLHVHDIGVDGNKANNTGTADGILIFAWLTTVEDCHVYNCTGNGIVYTDADDAGTFIATSGQNVENRIRNNRVQTCDARGIYVWEQSGDGNLTDGFCENNIVNSCALDGILIQRGAGWHVIGNHTYTGTGLGTMGIRVQRCFSTRITDNYVDNYGQSATTGFYSGIRAEIHDVRGSVIANNTISCTEDTAGSTYRHLYVLASTSITTARAVVAGNVIVGNAATNGTGIRIEAGSGTNLSCHVFGNKVDNCNTSFTGVATGTLSGRFDLYGSGSPESNITAPIGATWTRSDGSTSTTLYVKESGTGNTGWVAVGSGGVTSVDGNTGAVTASQLLTSIKTVDGSGSGLDADLLDGQSSAAFEAAGTAAGLISDTAYGAGWNADTTHAPSKNAVYDKIETLDAAKIDKSTGTAKGDLLVFTGSATPSVLAVGTDGQIPTADSTAASGLRYVTNTFNRIGSFIFAGHSWLVFGGSGGDEQSRRAEGVAGRFASMENISTTEVISLGRSGAQLTSDEAMPKAGWPSLLQLFVPPSNLRKGIPGTTPSAPYACQPGGLFMLYGINDTLTDVRTNARGVSRAYPHALRSAISAARSGGTFNEDHASVGFSGFATTVTTSSATGTGYKKSVTNGDTFTVTLPSDFPGGTVAVQMIGTADVNTALGAAISSAGATSITISAFGKDTIPTSGSTLILIDSEQMLVTAGAGTTTLTVTRGVNGTTATTHSNAAAVTGVAGASITWSGTCTGASGKATTQLSAQGLANANGGQGTVPITTRFTGLTAADAGTTIIGTVASIPTTAGEQFCSFDCYRIEAPVPKPIVVCNAAKYAYGGVWALNTDAVVANLNSYITSVVAEFDSTVTVADVEATFTSYGGTLGASMNATDVTTTVSITAGANGPNVGEFVRIGTEDCFITAKSGSNYTLVRGVNSTTKATHSSSDVVYNRSLYSNDNVHPSTYGYRVLAGLLKTTFGSMSLTAAQLNEANGYYRVEPQTLRNGTYFTSRGQRGKLATTNGKVTGLPIVLHRPVVVKGLAVEVLTAGAANSVMRLGIAGDNGGGFIDQLILDAGTVTTTSTGKREVTGFRQFLNPGVYWLLAAPQGSPATNPVVRSVLELPSGSVQPTGTGDPNGEYWGSAVLTNSGSGTFTAFGTSATTSVAHGLSITPDPADVSWNYTSTQTNPARHYVTTDATNINWVSAQAFGTPTFSWKVDARQNTAEFGKSGWTQTSVTGAFSDPMNGMSTAGEAILVSALIETVEPV